MKIASYTTDVQYIWKINKLGALSRQQLAEQSMLCSGGQGAHPQEIFKISPSELDSGVILPNFLRILVTQKPHPFHMQIKIVFEN